MATIYPNYISPESALATAEKFLQDGKWELAIETLH
jgi:hypothetical protein